jgi:FemAB-related protein (PEP-CTERM system-associated)
MDVEILNKPDSVCDTFVTQRPDSKICHLYAWGDMIANYIGLKNFYLVARERSQIHGVLPLMQVNSRLFGNRMISQAFSNYGGPLAEDQATLDALYNRAVELVVEHKCESIEFRNVKPLPYELHLRTDKVTMHLPIALDADELCRGFRPEIRNRIRKAEKSGLITVNGGLELLEDFYRVWTVRMRQLGTPCYPSKLMRSILEAFPNNSRLFIVRYNNLPVGGGFTTCFNGFADMQWVATLTEYNNLAPNNLLYWSAIKHYCLAGASWFDFGRSTVDSSTYEFKRRWGAEPVRLYYQYWVHPEHKLTVLSPDNPKYQRKVQIWQKLPLWVTRVLGPYISRDLP